MSKWSSIKFENEWKFLGKLKFPSEDIEGFFQTIFEKRL